MKRVLCRIFVVLFALTAFAFAEEDVVVKAMKDEMSRSVGKLELPNLDKPYFIGYRVDDATMTTVTATLGKLTASERSKSRTLFVQVRVGDYAQDNTNFLSVRSGPKFFANSYTLPIDNDYDQLRREIWLATDSEYKESAEVLASKKSVLQHREGGTNLPDFTKEAPTTVIEPPSPMNVNTADLEKLARDVSGVFRQAPDVLNSSVAVVVRDSYTRYVTTEGTTIARPEPFVIVTVRVQMRGKDANPMQDSFEVYGKSVSALHHDELVARTSNMLTHLKALRAAGTIELYNGPVLFQNEAAAEVIGQVFAPALVASRFPVTDEPQFEANLSQTLTQFGASLADKMGGRVMPDFMDVTNNPTATTFEGTQLLGTYKVDEEGVPSREVQLVNGGILKALLATRTPSPQAKASTGSARFMGASPANLFVSSRKGVSDEELRKQLISMAKQRGYDYGVVVRHVGPVGLSYLMKMAGTMSGGANPVQGADELYKVYEDGHEELVRNAEIAPMMVSAFKDIVAAGDKQRVYSTPFVPLVGSILGAGGSGSAGNIAVVSYVVPSLLFDEVSIKEATGPAPKPPVVPPPVVSGN